MTTNALGRLLRYFVDAWRYAGLGARSEKARSPGMFADSLTRMAQIGAARGGDTIDTDAAYRLAVTSAWVWSDIRLIADRIASDDARFQIKQRTGDSLEDLGNHPFELLLKTPNTFMAGSFMLRYLVWWYLLRGNAFIFVSTQAPGIGEPRELWPLPADLVRPLPETLRPGRGVFNNQQVIDFEYTVGGVIHRLPGENVVHFRMPNPFDWWDGLSPLTAALLGIQVDHSMQRWSRDFFRTDNAIPAAIASLPPDINPVDFEATVASVREQIERGIRILFTRSGDLKMETLQQTLEQMQIVQSRQFNRDEIDRVFGVPQGLISGGLSGDSRLAAEIAFARNTVQTILDYFADELSAGVAPYYGANIVIQAPNVIPQDRALAVAEYAQYSQDRTINENRAVLGKPALEVPEHLRPYVDQIPVRLIQFIAAGGIPITPPKVEQPGAMAGQQPPEQVAEAMTGKALTAAQLGIKAELDRWRRVALKEARAGRDPGAREFESDVLPDEILSTVRTALAGADEEGVRAAFASIDVAALGNGHEDSIDRDEHEALILAAARVLTRGT